VENGWRERRKMSELNFESMSRTRKEPLSPPWSPPRAPVDPAITQRISSIKETEMLGNEPDIALESLRVSMFSSSNLLGL
jgi:hypothetical protein